MLGPDNMTPDELERLTAVARGEHARATAPIYARPLAMGIIARREASTWLNGVRREAETAMRLVRAAHPEQFREPSSVDHEAATHAAYGVLIGAVRAELEAAGVDVDESEILEALPPRN